jgi:hypothetical protein
LGGLEEDAGRRRGEEEVIRTFCQLLLARVFASSGIDNVSFKLKVEAKACVSKHIDDPDAASKEKTSRRCEAMGGNIDEDTEDADVGRCVYWAYVKPKRNQKREKKKKR